MEVVILQGGRQIASLVADAVESLLRRARAVLADADTAASATVDDAAARVLVDRYVEAFERFDVDALVALLHEDVTLSMPPYPMWLRGVDAVRTFFGTIAGTDPRPRCLPIAANGSPGFAIYKPTGPGGRYEAFGIEVIEQSEGRIIGVHAFLDPRLFALFGVPPTLTR